MSQRRWSKEEVVSRILALHRSGGKLNSNYVQKNHTRLYQAACVYYNGWRQAIEAAGFSYDDVRVQVPARKRVWSKSIIIERIKKLYFEDVPLNSNYIQTKQLRLYGAAVKYFKGWEQAIESAGIEYDSVRKVKFRVWTKADIADEITQRVSNGLSINGSIVSAKSSGLYHAACRHFGKNGWSKARMLAGFDPVDPNPCVKWSESTVYAEIHRLHENGVALNSGALIGSYGYIRSAGEKVFGSWEKAIKATGLDYNKIRKTRKSGWWTKPRIIMCIKNLEKRGVRLSSKAIQHSNGALFGAAVVHFGCWSQAVEAAGISYRKHCRIWSTKAWLRKMSSDDLTTLTRFDQNSAT